MHIGKKGTTSCFTDRQESSVNMSGSHITNKCTVVTSAGPRQDQNWTKAGPEQAQRRTRTGPTEDQIRTRTGPGQDLAFLDAGAPSITAHRCLTKRPQVTDDCSEVWKLWVHYLVQRNGRQAQNNQITPVLLGGSEDVGLIFIIELEVPESK